MADKFGLSGVDFNLSLIGKSISDLKALKEAMSGNPVLKGKIVIEGIDDATRKVEKLADRQAAAIASTEKTVHRSMKVDRAKAEAFIAQRSGIVNALNAAGRQDDPAVRGKIYGRAGLSPNLASEAELLRTQRQRLDLLLRINRATQEGNKDEAEDAFVRYNKVADIKHRFPAGIRAEELEFQSSNQAASLSRQIGLRENRLAYRAARDAGILPDKTQLTDAEIDSR